MASPMLVGETCNVRKTRERLHFYARRKALAGQRAGRSARRLDYRLPPGCMIKGKEEKTVPVSPSHFFRGSSHARKIAPNFLPSNALAERMVRVRSTMAQTPRALAM